MSPAVHDTDVEEVAYHDDADPLFLASENQLLRARVARLEASDKRSGWTIFFLSAGLVGSALAAVLR